MHFFNFQVLSVQFCVQIPDSTFEILKDFWGSVTLGACLSFLVMLTGCPLTPSIAEEVEFSLPQEAFPLRHEIVEHATAPEPPAEKAESPQASGGETESVCLTPMESFSLISVSQLLFQPRLLPGFFNAIVKDTLAYYAEQGDVQMAVSALIVLGERIRKEVDELTQVRRAPRSFFN